MAKKIIKVTGNVCGNCGRGKWVESELNVGWELKPILLTCPEFDRHILRSQNACDKIKLKLK
jgi:hypothetical protein